MRQDTLIFLLRKENSEILLAMKKRGFGMGKLNGVGGKVEAGETVTAAAVREAKEEIEVSIQESDLRRGGRIHFSFEGKPEWTIECHVFFAEIWQGEPRETEEMAPQWFPLARIPFERMWVDDQFWLPRALSGEIVDAAFHFSSDGSKILKQEF